MPQTTIDAARLKGQIELWQSYIDDRVELAQRGLIPADVCDREAADFRERMKEPIRLLKILNGVDVSS